MVALNLSYDVSVKIWSINLLTLSFVLIAPDLRRLVNVLVLNRPSSPVTFSPLFRYAKHNRIAFRIGMACLVITFAFRALGIANGRGQSYSRTPTPVFGIYEVESFTSNEVLLPPLLTDARRWRMVIIERSGLASIRLMNDEILDYLTSVDTSNGTVTFVANPDTTVTTAGATRLAYNPHLIDVRFEQAIEANPDAGLMLAFSRPADDRLVSYRPVGKRFDPCPAETDRRVQIPPAEQRVSLDSVFPVLSVTRWQLRTRAVDPKVAGTFI